MKTYTYREKQFINAQRDLIKLHVQREEIRESAGINSPEWNALTLAMHSENQRISSIKGQLIREEHPIRGRVCHAQG